MNARPTRDAAPAPVVLRPATPDDIEPCGRIIYAAFKQIETAHGYPPGFPTVAAGVERAAHSINDPRTHGVVAEHDGRILGSGFMTEHDPVRGIGPVTVDPEVQQSGVGRWLMRALIGRGGDAPMRLVQAPYNAVSLALYASLGFDVREPLVTVSGRARSAPLPDTEIRPAMPADLRACETLCRRVHGFPRTEELRDALATGTAYVAVHQGHLVAYTSGLAYAGHSVAIDEVELANLVAGVTAATGREHTFLLPIRQADLLRWCLTEGFRLERPRTLMALGAYQDPAGAFLPSILY